ncbi:MAG: electron transport complex subunit RsxC [Candidatus Omnitrophica bacterium]|nr:electron transport complex subunit RsxC [Candidatus Omnitrophota bacterium]MBD3268941.1 electron transport complex subunit RsxC [Candidatus Omnitrophota bacterium]
MVVIEEHKHPQHNIKSQKFDNPDKLYLPVSQHTGKPASVCMEKGAEVEEGQLIARQNGYISACIHAPKGSKVTDITPWYHPNFGRMESLVLKCTKESKSYKTRSNVGGLYPEELLDIIQKKGIVGMGGAAFPTHVKLKPPKNIDTLIINGCECEPYLSADYRLMKENLKEICKGVELICRIVKPKKVIFALEDNKSDVAKKINLFSSIKKFNIPGLETTVLKSTYPQGGEKQLIFSTTRRKISGDKLPLDVGCIVQNVATCFAVYEAVYLDKPLIERMVSFCGDALEEPKNIWVRIGTTLQELFEKKILSFAGEPKKIISGGPMMGVTLDCLNYPVLKGTGGFLFLNRDAKNYEEQPCIKCGRCVDVCPMNLMPLMYAKMVKHEEFGRLNEFYIKDCIECGCCAYICPSRIPLVHYVKTGKKYAVADK